MYFLLNFSNYVKSCWHFCQILAFFTILTHQIWSCYVTQEKITKMFYLVLILHLILRKVAKFLVRKLFTSEVISQKPHWGGGGGGLKTPPPSAFKAKILLTWNYRHITSLSESRALAKYTFSYLPGFVRAKLYKNL